MFGYATDETLDGGAVVRLRVHTVVLSSQHAENTTTEHLCKEIKGKIMTKVVPAKYHENTVYHPKNWYVRHTIADNWRTSSALSSL